MLVRLPQTGVVKHLCEVCHTAETYAKVMGVSPPSQRRLKLKCTLVFEFVISAGTGTVVSSGKLSKFIH